jgi:hypothetical protein
MGLKTKEEIKETQNKASILSLKGDDSLAGRSGWLTF